MADWLMRLAAGCMGVVVLVFAAGAGSASASTGYAPGASFAPAEGFAGPLGLAVDDSGSLSKGSVYVVDSGHEAVDAFKANGELLSSVALPGGGPYGLSVDESSGPREGDVLVTGFQSGVVYRYAPGLGGREELVTGLSQPTGVAVDEAGDVFVSEFAENASQGKVLEFNAAGEPVNAKGEVSIANVAAEELNAPQAVAVSASGGDLYVATSGGGTIRYSLIGGTEYVADKEPLDASESLGVSIVPSGDVFVDQGSSVAVYEPAATRSGGVLLSTFGANTLSGDAFGVGMGESGDVYVADAGMGRVFVFEPGAVPQAPATDAPQVSGRTATFHGVLAGGTSEYHFAYNTGGGCEGGSATSSTAGSDGDPVQGEAQSLSAFSEYSVCLVASNRFGSTVGPPVSFTAGGGAPEVTGVSLSAVGVSRATVSAHINPSNSPTIYSVQYGTSSAYGSETQPAELPAVEESLAVSVGLAELAPGSEYHVRFVAANAVGSSESVLVLRTLPVGVQGLPDGRVYEMVTPANNQNAETFVPQGIDEILGAVIPNGIQTAHIFQVSTDGDRVTYIAGPTTGGNGEGKVTRGNQYMATRSPDGGWTQTNLMAPGQIRSSNLYQAFSSDLSVGFVSAGTSLEPGSPALSPEAPDEGYRVLYQRDLESGAYRSLFTRNPNPLTPSEFGVQTFSPSGISTGRQQGPPAYAGSSADLNQSLFEANGALTADAPQPAVATRNNLYDSSTAGGLSLVNVLPDGVAEANATFGAPPIVEGARPDFSRVISSDGSRVFWTDLNTHVLYASESVGTAGERTVQVDASQGPGAGGGGRYWTASSDGSEVFFTDCNRLTPDSTAVLGAGGCEPGGPVLAGSDLYEYDVPTGHLSDLTVDSNATDPLGADVQGVIGASEDGDYVYFVAEGILANEASAGQPNLYLWHAGATTLIATLSPQDGDGVGPFQGYSCSEPKSEECLIGDWQPGLGARTAEVTPDGHSIVFMSSQGLTTYPSERTYPNQGADEVYLYDASAGHLVCVSCSRSGEAPPATILPSSPSNANAAAFVPVSWSNVATQRYVSDDGSRVVFDSAVPLVPQDTDGGRGMYPWARGGLGVYEWEREGTGSCREVGGCVYLLSDGKSAHWSWFAGMSASGDDVFIVTRSQLVAQDRNEYFDLYDARVGGVSAVASQECVSDCQGPSVAAAAPGAPGSLAGGPGNLASPVPVVGKTVAPRALTVAQKRARALVACRKKRQRKRRLSCEAQVRKRYRQNTAKGRS